MYFSNLPQSSIPTTYYMKFFCVSLALVSFKILFTDNMKY